MAARKMAIHLGFITLPPQIELATFCKVPYKIGNDNNFLALAARLLSVKTNQFVEPLLPWEGMTVTGNGECDA